MVEAMNRRRAISIMAATAGLPLFARPTQASLQPVIWNGQALGAPATLVLYHPDQASGRSLIQQVMAEVSRLENVFSLYRKDSSLSELNRTGALSAPPKEMVDLLQVCRTFWEMSDGVFDPTVQPLWMLYGRHFSRPGSNPEGPSVRERQQALARVGFDGVHFNRDRVAFGRAGMGLTLNGIAQGYITDRIVDLLRNAGVTSSLVDMGENRAIGGQPDGNPWRIGLAIREDDNEPDTVVNIVDTAVATSSAASFHFDDGQRFGHIIDPRTGMTPQLYARMTVVARSAGEADALSTAFSLMDQAKIRSLVDLQQQITVDLLSNSGEHLRFVSNR